MRLILLILTLTISNAVFGQIVNSLSGNNTGMFYYSVDSLIRILKNEKRIERIVLKADGSIIQSFPETIHGIKIIKQDKNKEFKKRDIVTKDIIFVISGLTLIRNQITLSIQTYERTENGMPFFGQGHYIFYFKYIAYTDTYKLTKVKSGFTI